MAEALETDSDSDPESEVELEAEVEVEVDPEGGGEERSASSGMSGSSGAEWSGASVDPWARWAIPADSEIQQSEIIH